MRDARGKQQDGTRTSSPGPAEEAQERNLPEGIGPRESGPVRLCEPTDETAEGPVSRRMIRRLCPRCRRPYTPSLNELAEIGIPPGDYLFYRPGGCESCAGTGYEGAVGVRAALPPMARAIAASGCRSIIDSCRRLVLDGVTSVQEVYRVLDGG